MKIRTVIEDRMPKRKPKSFSQNLSIAMGLVLQVTVNTIMPFALGFYFCLSKNLFFLFPFILNLLFSIKITHKRDKIHIAIVR